MPDGWSLSSVGAACDIRNDLRLPLAVEVRKGMRGPFPYYGPTGILGYINEYRVDGDYALIGEDGDHFLDVENKTQTIRVSGRINVNNHAHIVGGTPMCQADWFYYFFQHRDIYHSLTRQGAGRFKLTKAALERLPILLPPKWEQIRIAEILRSWETAIGKMEALRISKKSYYDALTTILTNNPDYEQQHLRQHLREVSERNRGVAVDLVLSVTNSAGFVLSEEQFAHRVASADLSNYKIVRRDQYAYNPSRINVGSIARLSDWDVGALSPMYVVFEVSRGLDSDFFDHWLGSSETKQRIRLAAQGSVRDSVGFGDLCTIMVPVPTMDRQRAVAQALNSGREEIRLITTEIAALARQKHGLMQKLLTGEWRVKLEGGALG